MRNYVAYIRVSTPRQGEHGVSLIEQKDAIARYAERNGLGIVKWFEERETAAKQGRPIFNQMLKALNAGRANGVIIHKIDRSARNLRDWADLVELSEGGIEVKVATENLDLQSRGGMLSANIQAVVAMDFIRNLREETRKGFYGRLKQGLYPLAAPVGYLDRGKGRPKEPDPDKAHLVRKAFELYATNRYGLVTLLSEVTTMGLRNRNGRPLSLNGLSRLLNNPFYTGIIRLSKSREVFEGIHSPIVTKNLFDRVQRVLRGKTNIKLTTHFFVFRKLLQCDRCGLILIGELQKGHVYYRCHNRNCPIKCIREEQVEARVKERIASMRLTEEEHVYIKGKLREIKTWWQHERERLTKDIELKRAQIHDRFARLTDGYLDGIIDRDLFEERKAVLIAERQELKERESASTHDASGVSDRVQEFLELASTASLLYETLKPDEKRDFINVLTSNRPMRFNHVAVELPFSMWHLADRHQLSKCDPYRGVPRTWDALLPRIIEWVKSADISLRESMRPFLNLLQGSNKSGELAA
jgi:site-specific DNA recombinase